MKNLIEKKIRLNLSSLKTKIFGGGLILIYHRVTNVKPDVQVLSVSPENFSEQMKILKDYYNPISLIQLYEASKKGRIPPNSVVLTFDDGYVDNFTDVKPILDYYNIPATIFVTAGLVDNEKEFWWHELEQIIFSNKKLPADINIKINNKEYHWELTIPEQIGTEIDSIDFNWGITDPSPSNSRQRMYSDLSTMMDTMKKDDREFILKTFRELSGFHPIIRNKFRALSSEELIELKKGNLVDIGAHTIWHSPLPFLTKEEQWNEIKGSKDLLEKIIGKAVRTFAYPYSNEIGFNQNTLDLVRSAGFQVACAYTPGQVRFRSNPFQFPRLLVRNWGSDIFRETLKEWAN